MIEFTEESPQIRKAARIVSDLLKKEGFLFPSSDRSGVS